MGAIFLILLFSPVLLIVALLVKLSSPGPVICSQERVPDSIGPAHLQRGEAVSSLPAALALHETGYQIIIPCSKISEIKPLSSDFFSKSMGSILSSISLRIFHNRGRVMK